MEKMMTRDGSYTLLDTEVGEAYHSHAGAVEESVQLYCKASGFSQRLRSSGGDLRVLDIGLGLGYNALKTLELWFETETTRPLHLVSLEQNRSVLLDLIGGTGIWQENWSHQWREWCQSLTLRGPHFWQAEFRNSQGARAIWDIALGDAAGLEPAGFGQFDFFWQDPFSPQKNPSLWTTEWFGLLRTMARPGSTLVTYSVARIVRDNLQQAGWQIEKIPTSTHKKSWLKAQLIPPKEFQS